MELVWPPGHAEEKQFIDDWANFQVFLDFDVNYDPTKLPDCHGIIVTSKLVLSRALCISEFGGHGSQRKFNFLRVIKVPI